MLTTRTASLADASLIATHRYRMFAEMGQNDEASLAAMQARFLPWVERMIAREKYVGWIVVDDGKPAASAGFFELDWAPHPLDPDAEHRGYLLNFWVEPFYRGRGIARQLVHHGLAESRRRGLRVTALHASPAGRRVYATEGFEMTSEMFHIARADR
jgi:ribosomal protein S18 acetylase RimI-like enzyme